MNWSAGKREILRQEIRHRLDAMRDAVGKNDHEVAHGIRDLLFELVLTAIAEGYAGKDEAALALETQKIDFKEWCA